MAQNFLVRSTSELDIFITSPVLHRCLSPTTGRSNRAPEGRPFRSEPVPGRDHSSRAYLGADSAVLQAGKNLRVVRWVRILDFMVDFLVWPELILVGMACPERLPGDRTGCSVGGGRSHFWRRAMHNPD